MIYTVTLNPALDKTVRIPNMAVDAVNRISQVRTDPGGKGINVSKVIASLGGSSRVVALLGGNTGRYIADALEKMGLSCQFTFVPGETRTNLKVVDPLRHTNTDINEPGPGVSEAVLDAMLQELTAQLQSGDIVVLSGRAPAGAPADTYFHWVSRCRAAGAWVFLDADGALLEQGLRACPDLIKPNREELSRLAGRPLETVRELTLAGRELLERGVENVVISLGDQGALFLSAAGTIHADGLSVPVGSTVGAGDSMVAALAVARERGLSAEETVRLAVAVSAANVMCSGSQSAPWETVAPLLDRVTLRRI